MGRPLINGEVHMTNTCDSNVGKTQTSNRGMIAMITGIAAGFAVLLGLYAAFVAR